MTNIPHIFLYESQGALPFVVRRESWPREAALLITDVQPRHTRNGWFGDVTGFALNPRSDGEYWGTEEEPVDPSCSGCYQWYLVPEEEHLPEWSETINRQTAERRDLPPSVVKWLKGWALSDKMKFGKYKGRTFEAVLADDPSYIRWAIQQGAVRFNDDSMRVVETALSRAEGAA